MLRTCLLFLLVLGVSACTPKLKAPPPPLRPKPIEMPAADTSRKDCEEIEADEGFAALTYEERSIREGENLASEGFRMLRLAETRGTAPLDRERLIDQSVDRFVKALLADPYNVHATYNLAAAYARIGRYQCSINLLARLVPLHRLHSQRAKVEGKLDRLLGRRDFKGRLDPDFFELRDDARFRTLVVEFGDDTRL